MEDDASALRGGFGMSSIDLLKTAREARPDACIVQKPHPDAESARRRGAVPEAEVLRHADCLLKDFPMGSLLPLVHEVHTLTSQTGFEALLRGVRVFTYGGPFYAGWGLTEDRRTFPRRRAKLLPDDLVAGVLLLYPSYYDWRTGTFCRAEDVCRLLNRQKSGTKRGLRSWLEAVARCFRRSRGE